MSAGGRLIAPAELKALSARSNARGLAHAALHLALLAGSATLVWLARETIWLLLPALLLHGWFLVALFAPVHETVHMTAFASRRLNLVVGWLAALPGLMDWHFYQQFHFAHHRHTQDLARDPELHPPPPATRLAYLWRLAGLESMARKVVALARLAGGDVARYRYIEPGTRARVTASARLMVAAYVLLVSGAALAGALDLLLLYWIVPLLLAQPLLRGWLTAEHTGCAHSADGLANTRTTEAGWLMRLSTWNMSFHAEHHLWPSIPFHALPAAHSRIRPRLAAIGTGYLAVNRGLWRALPA